eukprot:SM000203S06138  [mRNA]  locus=s203:183385:185474:+ [translate_table: standard]
MDVVRSALGTEAQPHRREILDRIGSALADGGGATLRDFAGHVLEYRPEDGDDVGSSAETEEEEAAAEEAMEAGVEGSASLRRQRRRQAQWADAQWRELRGRRMETEQRWKEERAAMLAEVAGMRREVESLQMMLCSLEVEAAEAAIATDAGVAEAAARDNVSAITAATPAVPLAALTYPGSTPGGLQPLQLGLSATPPPLRRTDSALLPALPSLKPSLQPSQADHATNACSEAGAWRAPASPSKQGSWAAPAAAEDGDFGLAATLRQRQPRRQGPPGLSRFADPQGPLWGHSGLAAGALVLVATIAAATLNVGGRRGAPARLPSTLVAAPASDGAYVPQLLREARPGVMELHPANFYEMLRLRPTFVMFYAPWCPYSGAAGRFKYPRMADAYEVPGFPTLMLFRRLQPVASHLGPRDLDSLLAFLELELA